MRPGPCTLLAKMPYSAPGASGPRKTVDAAQVKVRLGDGHAPDGVAVRARVRVVPAFMVVAGCDQDPIAGAGGVDRILDGRVVAGLALERSHSQHGPGGRAG